jgi:hypothetical protein
MATDDADSMTNAAADHHARLRQAARRLYRDRVKPALTSGLLDVRP